MVLLETFIVNHQHAQKVGLVLLLEHAHQEHKQELVPTRLPQTAAQPARVHQARAATPRCVAPVRSRLLTGVAKSLTAWLFHKQASAGWTGTSGQARLLPRITTRLLTVTCSSGDGWLMATKAARVEQLPPCHLLTFPGTATLFTEWALLMTGGRHKTTTYGKGSAELTILVLLVGVCRQEPTGRLNCRLQ